MRHARLSVGLVATVCAFAIGATPALAHEFVASATGNISGKVESTQSLKFGPFKITCLKAADKGAVAAGTTDEFATSIKFSKCTTEGKIGSKKIMLSTHFMTPLAVEYHANRFVETGSELEEEEGATVLAGGTAEIKVPTGVNEEFRKSTCVIEWPEQTLPKKAEQKPNEEYAAVGFSNASTPKKASPKFPDGMQHSIVVSNEFKGIKYEFEGEPCEEWGKEEGPEGGGGTYFGSFPVVLSGGSLEYR